MSQFRLREAFGHRKFREADDRSFEKRRRIFRIERPALKKFAATAAIDFSRP
jgi:hypothetical protein